MLASDKRLCNLFNLVHLCSLFVLRTSLLGVQLTACTKYRPPKTEVFLQYEKNHLARDYRTLYFTQPVDHFSYSTSDTFLQRYLVFDKYFLESGPIFFYTGNEGDIVWFYNNTGIMLEWAADFNALVVFAEHRYYGMSLPYGEDSFKGLNHVGYLSSEQALADFVSLIDFIKHNETGASQSPVIAFGGSYGGMLAAWLRMKYPHSVVGALAASAPIWMFDDLVPCERYSQIVTHDFNISGPNCAANIRRSWKVISDFGSTDSGRSILSYGFGLCDPLKSVSDVERLKNWLDDTWNFLAMGDYPYPASFLQPLPAWPIKVVCSHLTNESLTDMQLIGQLRNAINVYYNYSGSAECFNTNQSAVGSLDTIGWDFQSCTEMVMPICSDGINDMFEPKPWNITQVTSDCMQRWNVVPRPHWIVEEFGGKNISAASNIIFSNGDLDPWLAGGVTESISSSLIAILIKDGAHHLDLRSSHPDDIQSLIEARKREKAIVASWIRSAENKDPRQSLTLDMGNEPNVRVICMSDESVGCFDVATEPPLKPSVMEEVVVCGIVIGVFIFVLVLVGFNRHRSQSQVFDLESEPFAIM